MIPRSLLPDRFRLGSPLQLLLLVCSFALAGYAGVRLLAGGDTWWQVVLWFVGLALLHDLVLLPLYSAADRALTGAAGGHRAYVMYVRVPAVLSGLLLLVWFPLISGRVAERYLLATGRSVDGFLARWLLITAVLFAGSALLLVRRLRRATKQRPPVVH
ncbi:hypothetical protein [Streptomyces adustus]